MRITSLIFWDKEVWDKLRFDGFVSLLKAKAADQSWFDNKPHHALHTSNISIPSSLLQHSKWFQNASNGNSTKFFSYTIAVNSTPFLLASLTTRKCKKTSVPSFAFSLWSLFIN